MTSLVRIHYLTPETVEFFKEQGFRVRNQAELRRYSKSGNLQTVQLMVAHDGAWCATQLGWIGPLAATPKAAFVAAELLDWGGQTEPTPRERAIRALLKNQFRG